MMCNNHNKESLMRWHLAIYWTSVNRCADEGPNGKSNIHARVVCVQWRRPKKVHGQISRELASNRCAVCQNHTERARATSVQDITILSTSLE